MDIQINKRKEEIINLKNSIEFKKLNSYYSQKSFFNILDISRKEVVHSSFLAWLFTPAANHELGDYPLKKLLEVLIIVLNRSQKSNKEAKFPEELEDIIVAGNYSVQNVLVEREKNTGGNGFIDVYIEMELLVQKDAYPLRLIIENKVKSKEGDQQTNRYYNWATDLTDNEKAKNIFIFLTPLPNAEFEKLSEPQCECKQYIQLNYQYLVDYVIEPCRRMRMPHEAEVFIDNYLRTLSYPSLQTESNEADRGDIVMAIGERERNLLRNFWDVHKDILIATISALKDDPEISDEEREKIAVGLEAFIKTDTKDNTKYNFNGVLYPKSRLVLAVVKRYVEDNPGAIYSELKKAFPDVIHGSARLGVVRTIGEARKIYDDTGTARHFIKDEEVIDTADESIAVCNQWGINKNDEYNSNINKFIRRAKELGYKIES